MIATGRLYIRTPTEIICYDIPDRARDGVRPR
jgi:hypothetical protein